MANELKYILWGIAMLIHGVYMLISHEVSFGWDTIVFLDKRLYLIVIPYLFFSIGIIIVSIMNLTKKKKGSDPK